MDKLFSLKKFPIGQDNGQQGFALAICVQNAFRPLNVDKEKIDGALRDLFAGCARVLPNANPPQKFPFSALRVVAWAPIESSDLKRVENSLGQSVEGLNSIYSYQRR